MRDKNGFIRSYGRLRGRKFNSTTIKQFEELFPKLQFKLDADLKEKDNKKHILEIGFGNGEHIAQAAIRESDANFIGCETFQNGIGSLLNYIEKEKIENIKIFDQDVRILLEKIEDNFFDKIYILFPDPWPKKKHKRRRLLNSEMLDLLHSKVSKEVVIATDHADYQEHIKEILASSKFNWNIIDFPEDWINTKYQEKAIIEGRNSIMFSCLK